MASRSDSLDGFNTAGMAVWARWDAPRTTWARRWAPFLTSWITPCWLKMKRHLSVAKCVNKSHQQMQVSSLTCHERQSTPISIQEPNLYNTLAKLMMSECTENMNQYYSPHNSHCFPIPLAVITGTFLPNFAATFAMG